MRRILKAEILLTRECNLRCNYCSIIRSGRKCINTDQWRQAIKNLKALGCEFVAIYGGEPTLEIDLLGDLIENCHYFEIPCTVITNCVDLKESAIDYLIERGLDSITVSIDSLKSNSFGASTSIRTNTTLWFLENVINERREYLRDVEVVTTVTPRNILELPDIVDWCESNNYWWSFDFYHYNRGGVGTKTALCTQIMFKESDEPIIEDTMYKLLSMKHLGFKIHQSIDVIKKLMNEPQMARKLDWHCSYPAWLSLDCDGSVLCCDDYEGTEVRKRFKIHDPDFNFDEFLEVWKKDSRECPGCFWTTHVMSEEMISKEKAGEYFAHKRLKL